MSRIDLTDENSDLVKKAAGKRGVSMNKFVNDVLTNLGINDKTITPIILQVPIEHIKKPDGFEAWFDVKKAALLNHFRKK